VIIVSGRVSSEATDKRGPTFTGEVWADPVLPGGGLICSYGERPRRLRPGDVVWVPPGERHWHGAAPGSFLIHLAISLGTTMWAQEVAEADYSTSPDREDL
jgi:AraC-like ligand binding domain